MMVIEVEPYANEIQRFYFEELKWCGCGNPAEALMFMRDVLEIMWERSENNRAEPLNVPYEQSSHANDTKRLNELLPLDSPLALSYAYLLCSLDLTEQAEASMDHGLPTKAMPFLRC